MSQLYWLEPWGLIVMLLGSTPVGGELFIHVTKRVLGFRVPDIPSRVKPARCLTGPSEWPAKRGTLNYQKKKRRWTETKVNRQVNGKNCQSLTVSLLLTYFRSWIWAHFITPTAFLRLCDSVTFRPTGP